MMEFLPRQAPQTWRDFFLRVAAIAVAALVVLGAIDLFESLHSSHATSAPAPHSERSTPPL
jgi:hypothetical protein